MSEVHRTEDQQFIERLRALGERMAADGKPVIKTLLHEAEVNGREKCRFANWPRHLQEEAYRWLGESP